jgi:hypothetical protein
MAEKQAEKPTGGRVTERQRFNYIGFDVFPGDPKDLFGTEAEKSKLVDQVRNRRQAHDTLRANNSLIEERISKLDRLVLTVAAVAMILALFFPFYSAYKEKVEESQVKATSSSTTAVGTEEVITGYVPKKKITKEYSSVTGIGSFAHLGDIFSGGPILMLTGVLMLLYTLACLIVPGYTLYGLYGLKGNADEVALKLKEILRFGWLPLLILVAVLLFSFLGSSYGSSHASEFTSFGQSYSVGVFFVTLSIGILISLIGGIVIAVKGIEI